MNPIDIIVGLFAFSFLTTFAMIHFARKAMKFEEKYYEIKSGPYFSYNGPFTYRQDDPALYEKYSDQFTYVGTPRTITRKHFHRKKRSSWTKRSFI